MSRAPKPLSTFPPPPVMPRRVRQSVGRDDVETAMFSAAAALAALDPMARSDSPVWILWLKRLSAFARSGDLEARGGRDSALDLLIEDISLELAGRPHQIARVAKGWKFRTRPYHAAAIRAARGKGEATRDLAQNEALVLTIIAYMQPLPRGAISRLTGCTARP